MTINSKFYWMMRRQLFLLQQRIFYVLSFLLLDNYTCSRIRILLLRCNGVKIGRRCFVRGGLQFQENFNLVLGDEVFINYGCLFDTSAPIILGSRTQIGFQATFITGGHQIGPHELRAGSHDPKPITVEEGVWIGARALILPGVCIGAGAVVAAGALVSRDVAPDTLVAGVPARVIRTLDAGSEERKTYQLQQ